MNPKSFASIVQDLAVDDVAFGHNLERLTPASNCYVILFTARSGSTWLTSVLSSTERLGYPEEYLNPNHVRRVAEAMQTRDPAGLLAMLKRKRQTKNGVFGIEVRHVDIELFGQAEFLAAFGSPVPYFHLWRDNIIAQGVSLYRAVVTGHFHATSDHPASPKPDYDAEQIVGWVRHVLNTENANITLLRRIGRTVHHLRYEDIVKDRLGTIQLFARALGVAIDPAEFTAPAAREPVKIGDDWNTVAELRLRQEMPGVVAEMESARLVRNLTGKEPPERG